MATADAILAFSTALQSQLQRAYPVPQGAPAIKVQLVHPHAFVDGLVGASEGFTICLYRVSVTTSHRNQPARRSEDGVLFRPSLPVDLHYLITPWAKTVETQLQMLGWLLRQMEMLAHMPAAGINDDFPVAAGSEPVFLAREAVEISYESLPSVDFHNLWDKMRKAFPVSATYSARMVTIDSTLRVGEALPVRSREYQYGSVPQTV